MRLQRGASEVEQEEGLRGQHGWHDLLVGCWSGSDWKLHMSRLHHRWHRHLSWPPLLGFLCGTELLHGESGCGFRFEDEWVVPHPPWHQQPTVSVFGKIILCYFCWLTANLCVILYKRLLLLVSNVRLWNNLFNWWRNSILKAECCKEMPLQLCSLVLLTMFKRIQCVSTFEALPTSFFFFFVISPCWNLFRHPGPSLVCQLMWRSLIESWED